MSIDETSILSLVRTLLDYRRNHTQLSQGEWHLLSRDSSILAYERRHANNRTIVVLNFTADPLVWSAYTPLKARVAISTHGDRRGEAVGSALKLRANESLILEQGVSTQV